ncbi:hypothetical protein [Blastococcus litoris]|uniref:hypothetical protein n=1 Tax=Blastococcus litoris TaxID=2171622 RepID=UPI001F12F7AF|nr:hypothetical protein [Blastococcus litoris]
MDGASAGQFAAFDEEPDEVLALDVDDEPSFDDDDDDDVDEEDDVEEPFDEEVSDDEADFRLSVR